MLVLQFSASYNYICMVAMVTVLLPWQQYKWCTNCAKCAHIIPIVKNHNYKFYRWLIVVAMAVAMATIVVDYT